MLAGTLVNLRPVDVTDVHRGHAWINDRDVARYVGHRYPLSMADEERWISEAPQNSARSVRLAIETKDGVHIGMIKLHDVYPEERRCGLRVMIGDKAYWSNGYGTDAIVTLLRFAFDEMNLNRVWLLVFDFNTRAYACYLKCGFREEGRLRQHYYHRGRYWDTIAMGILRNEFEALRGAAAEARHA
jgi:RimJ/RimL family protein N-acetyltransferase